MLPGQKGCPSMGGSHQRLFPLHRLFPSYDFTGHLGLVHGGKSVIGLFFPLSLRSM